MIKLEEKGKRMRKIKFKGYLKEISKWIYGDLTQIRLGKDIEEFVEIIGNAYDNTKLLKG